MVVPVVSIGNSRGIRIPKGILKQLDIHENVDLEVHDQEILIRPAKGRPREDWVEEFKRMHAKGDDTLIIGDLGNEDDFQWEW